MPAVLVLDGEQRAALAVVRSLGRAGERVYVASARPRSLAGASRHASAAAVTPDPLAAPHAFADAVVALAHRWNVDALLPITDASLTAVLPQRARLGPVCLPFPPTAVYHAISDKGAVLDAARQAGIAVPEQHVLAAPVAAEATPLDALRYPLVVKPARSVAGVGGARHVKVGVAHAAHPEALRDRLQRYAAEAYPLLLQQRVVGPGAGVFLLLWDGETIAAFAHRRIREKPPAGGVSVYRESVPLDPALLDASRALLQRFGWQGVAMVEFKLDASTGTPYLMEVNGRLWGSLQLAIDAGVDFPRLLLGAARGVRPTPVTSYRVGVRSRWWWGDVDHLLARLRHSDAALSLPPGAPGRLAAVRDFLRLWRPGDRSEVLRLSDPGPFVRETLDWFRGR